MMSLTELRMTDSLAGEVHQTNDTISYGEQQTEGERIAKVVNDNLGVYCERAGEHACVDCSRVLDSADQLARHRKVHHGVNKQYRCALCSRRFTLSSSLRVHEKRKHSELKPFQCVVCAANFSDRSRLTAHLHTHTGYKPHKCYHCGRCFTRQDVLRLHVRTHTGEKPYVCHICQLRFAQSSTLRSHLSTHSILAYAHATPVHYPCTVCAATYVKRGSLNRHMRVEHADMKPSFTCFICDKQFKQLAGLKVHIARCTQRNRSVSRTSQEEPSDCLQRVNLSNYFMPEYGEQQLIN